MGSEYQEEVNQKIYLFLRQNSPYSRLTGIFKKLYRTGPNNNNIKSLDLGSALDMRHLLHVLDGLASDHRGYNMKNAELFRNGQSKPEVFKETKEG